MDELIAALDRYADVKRACASARLEFGKLPPMHEQALKAALEQFGDALDRYVDARIEAALSAERERMLGEDR